MKKKMFLGALVCCLATLSTTIAEAVQISLNPTNVIGGSSSYPTGTTWDGPGSFTAPNIFNAQTGTISEPGSTYWLNGDDGPSTAYIVIDLGAAYRIKRVELFNTHNTQHNDRGTGNFNIQAGNAIANMGAILDDDLSGPISTIVNGTLFAETQANDPLEAQGFSVTNTNTFRYLRFNPTSVAAGTNGGAGCCSPVFLSNYGLNELRVFATDVVTFNETLGPGQLSLTTATTTTQADLDPFRVVKNIVNNSGSPLSGYDIALEVFNGTSFVASSNVDGISFDDPTLEATWAAGVNVLLNNVDQGPAGGTWDIDRISGPDGLSFSFNSFVVAPGDTLSLQFDMRSTTTNQWRLVQTAQVIPEPVTIVTWLLVGAGGLAFAFAKRRKLVQACRGKRQ